VGAKAATFLVMVLMHLFSPNSALTWMAQKEGITVTNDVSYGTGPRHTLDIYVPEKLTASAPVVVFFYGGGWESGSKEMYRFIGYALAAQGLVVVIPDYRLHPDVEFPAFMNDAAEAVEWAHVNAARLGGDPDRLFLMCHSAGAQIATLLSMDPEYLLSVSASPEHYICGVIGLAGPYDFLPLQRELKAVFGPEVNWPKSQPINYVSADAPPMLLLTGTSDGSVNYNNTLHLAERLRDKGAKVEDALYPGLGHTGVIAALSDTLTFMAPVRDATLSFIKKRGSCGYRGKEG
jgi:acetyl esterase/lipase